MLKVFSGRGHVCMCASFDRLCLIACVHVFVVFPFQRDFLRDVNWNEVFFWGGSWEKKGFQLNNIDRDNERDQGLSDLFIGSGVCELG